MKVVLQEHVDHLGERGEIVSVAPGFARNYLLPKRLALEATAGNLRIVEHRRKIWAVKDSKEVSEAEAIAARLSKLRLKIDKKAGESGTLYGSVTTTEIAALLESKGVVVDRRRILVSVPIKTVGEFEVAVKLHPRVVGRVKVEVQPEGGQLERRPVIEEPEEPDEDMMD